MRRHCRAGSASVKSRRRKAATPKCRNATTVSRRRSSAETQESKFARLARELDEALEQQVATSEVLKVISGSPAELDTVFQAENAVRICGAKFGVLYLCEGEHAARTVAMQ
jgi:adenylate cyclase